MSTVLTNGIIIPENGSRNWGGDLANNWNIIDLNIGYMNDVKNRVTTLENSVAENTANIEINTSNISALQTSKQDAIEDLETIRTGASAGATAVQPSTLDNYVDLSSEQTINGVKTFTSLYTQSAGPSLWMKNTSFTMGTAPATNRYSGVWVKDNNGTDIAYVAHQANKNNSQNLKFSVSNTDGSNTYQNALTFQANINGTFNFYSDTPANLGTAANKWKTINGINPGALSLPNASPSGFISKSLPSSGGTITADLDGWFELRTKATSPNALIQLFVAGGSSIYAKNTGDTLIISVPMRAGVGATIFYRDIETPTVCRLVPCAGNV